MRVLIASLIIYSSAFSSSYSAEPYEGELTWSANDGGVVECPGEFISHAVGECLPGGVDVIPRQLQGRACAMTRAIGLAKMGQCQAAFALSLITQCHNPGSQNILRSAGVVAVCDYLKRF